MIDGDAQDDKIIAVPMPRIDGSAQSGFWRFFDRHRSERRKFIRVKPGRGINRTITSFRDAILPTIKTDPIATIDPT